LVSRKRNRVILRLILMRLVGGNKSRARFVFLIPRYREAFVSILIAV